MNKLKKYMWNIIRLIGNEKIESRIKEIIKKLYFILPFGFFAFLFIPKNIKNRVKLIFGLNYFYDLNNDYATPDLNMKLSRISIWGGYKAKNKIAFYFKLDEIAKVCPILNDEYSKNLYLSAVFNYVSKKKGFLVCLYYSHIWKYYQNILLACEDSTHLNYNLFDLSKINLAPLKLYYSAQGIFCNFYLEQYCYKNLIKAQKGDYVIDGGACGGDTALYFANLVGESGKVFAFEFVEENIELFNKNLALNCHINNISLVKHPLYADSNTFVDYVGGGSSATINLNSPRIQTLSIDDFVKNNHISKIDFIKLDIEGSEFSALFGAKESIKRFKPKLAICLYHSAKDYTRIPLLLNEILPNYRFYFDHFTLGRYESVLFAICKD